MDAIVSNSVALSKPPFFLLRIVSSPSTSYSPSSVSSFTPCSTKHFCASSRIQRRFRFQSSIVQKFAVTCAGSITEINENQFSETVLKANRPVLVEFVANWCGPCRLISPAMESVAQEYGDRLMVIKIDHDANPRLIAEYKVYGLPTLILFKNGQEVPESRREGAITKAKLKEYLDSFLASISVT